MNRDQAKSPPFMHPAEARQKRQEYEERLAQTHDCLSLEEIAQLDGKDRAQALQQRESAEARRFYEARSAALKSRPTSYKKFAGSSGVFNVKRDTL